MPTQVVDVNLETETGAIAQDTFSDLLVVARNPTVGDPTFNDPLVFDTAAQVGSEFGSDSDAHTAAEEITDRGVRNWWTVMLDSTAHSEVIGNSDAESTDQGEVSNTPMRGGVENITVTLDGTEQTLEFTAETPPSKPDAGNAAINTDTGEVITGDSSSGADSGIVVEYETLSFDAARPEIDAGSFDLMVMADTRADLSYLGEADEIISWASSGEVSAGMVLAYENGNEYASDDDAMAAAHEMGGYLTSGNVLPVAHKSSADVASGIAGRLATKNPWFNPYMDGDANYGFPMDEYRRSLIGRPGTPGTFEGGDDNGDGPTNVLYSEMGTQILSNSLTTAGADSDYQFFDIARTESFIEQEVKRSLRGLQLSRDNIPFAPIGRTLIEATLRDRLNKYVSPQGRALSPEEVQDADSNDPQQAFDFGSTQRRSTHRGNVPLSELDIHVPRYDDLDSTDRANRVWSGIQIRAQLAGSAHTFSVELAVTV